jgi:hypothetical protein
MKTKCDCKEGERGQMQKRNSEGYKTLVGQPTSLERAITGLAD